MDKRIFNAFQSDTNHQINDKLPQSSFFYVSGYSQRYKNRPASNQQIAGEL